MTPRQLLADKEYERIFSDYDWEPERQEAIGRAKERLDRSNHVLATIGKMSMDDGAAWLKSQGLVPAPALWEIGNVTLEDRYNWALKSKPEWRRHGAIKRVQRLYAAICQHTWKPEQQGGTGRCEKNLGSEPFLLFGDTLHGKEAVCIDCATNRPTVGHSLPWNGYMERRKPDECANCQRQFWMLRISRSRISNKYSHWIDDHEDENSLVQVAVVFCSEYCRRNYVSVQSRVRPDPIECPVCHETFEPQRKTAKFCGATCRQKAKRLRDALDQPDD